MKNKDECEKMGHNLEGNCQHYKMLVLPFCQHHLAPSGGSYVRGSCPKCPRCPACDAGGKGE
jgi:hypothetical protein